MNTVLTYINESVTIVVENGHENPEVLAGARRIGRFLQLRSGRCPLSATAGGLVPLDDTMLSSRRIRHALDSETFEARQAPVVEMPHRRRSEEHTSELQSLMRISYAVFCLKKKK